MMVFNDIEKIESFYNKNYVMYDGKITNVDALKTIRPDLTINENSKFKDVFLPLFGKEFPTKPYYGEKFILLNDDFEMYIYNGIEWFLIDKSQYKIYLENDRYIRFLKSRADLPTFINKLSDEEKSLINL